MRMIIEWIIVFAVAFATIRVRHKKREKEGGRDTL